MSEFAEIPIGAHLKLTSGFPFASSQFSNEGFPLIRIRDVLSSRTETYYQGSFPPGYVIKKGDILVGMDGDFHVVRWNGPDALLNQRVLKVDVHDESVVVLDYLFHWLGPYVQKVNDITAATTVKHLSTKDLIKARASLPTAPVQRRIASILTTIDTAIEQTEALIEKYQHIKAGLMHDLFTRGVLPNGQLRPPREQAPALYQETAIGWIPREWKVSRLETILRDSGGHLQTGPFGSQLHAHEYQSEGVPVVMPQDINDGRIGTESIARISEKRAWSLAKHQLKVGDIIIARRGELSRAAAVTETEQGWLCGTGCFLLRIGRTELNHFFFSHIYRYDYIQRQIAGTQVGTTMPSLNNSVMGRVFFPCPTPKEQTEISARLSKSEREIDGLKEHAEKLKLQKLGLMQDLLTGKVAVAVDVPATEVAT